MSTDYRVLTSDDIEQSAYVESVAFYNEPGPARVEMARKYLPPEWTVGGFIDGKLIADVRTVPMVRRINGATMAFGAVGPVACLSAYRRQGHVGLLLRLALETMRDRGQVISGLHTPHDALYARYGWERAEGRIRYQFFPKDIHLRHRGEPGNIEQVIKDDWERLARIYQQHVAKRNGAFTRNAIWWQVAVLGHFESPGEIKDNQIFVWTDTGGQDQGYVVYSNRPLPQDRDWPRQVVHIRDFVALTGDAYIGLWQHMLTHDLADYVVAYMPPDDPFPNLVHDPFRVQVSPGYGAMLRIVDVEKAIAQRPCVGDRPAAFTMRVLDHSAPWNEAIWRVQTADGRMQAERVDSEADVELTANTLAPLFTAHMTPEVAANVGLLRVFRPEAVQQMTEAFRALYPPYCHDSY
ncbi:MAG TPA: GNAT family N-acetyltransferase [Dehalococcoidia bacterium]|nr:GNAT family N-acetyltransferase [Dehalococcoidia bacterium]